MGPPQSPHSRALPDTKRQKLLKCVLTGNSKLYLGKVYTEDQLAKLSEEEVEKLFNNYEAMLSGQMVKSLGHSVINMYSMRACAALGISNQDALSEDLAVWRASFPSGNWNSNGDQLCSIAC